MIKFSQIVALIFLLGSCKEKENYNKGCTYTFSRLNNYLDSSKLISVDYGKDEIKEVLDKGNNLGQRGLYKFDKNNILRFYGFLINTKNECDYCIEYDSLGRVANKTGTEVVQWYFRKLRGDSLAITFLLYTVNQSYSDLRIEYGLKRFNNIELQESETFSNLIGSTLDVEIQRNSGSDTVYIYGKKVDLCTSKDKAFKDFILVPKEVL